VCGLFFAESALLTNLQLQNIGESLRHRGPDGQGCVEDRNLKITALHSRLAIQDIDARSNQPFFSHNKKSFIIYNGELFNKPELAQSLKDKVQLRTTSDTEVLIEMIQLFGVDYTLNVLKGMFAFIYVDIPNNIIVAARDQFGIKPLFYYPHSSLGMLFFSEIEVISNLTELTLNHAILRDFILFGLVDHSVETFYDGVMRIPAGTLLERRNGEWRNRVWFKESLNENLKEISYSEYVEVLDSTLEREVQSSTISDCPIALNLSSGVDSQLIYRYIAPLAEKLQLHHVSWENSPHSENQLVRKSLRAGDLLHEHIFSAEQVWELVQNSFEIQNEPYTSPFVAVWSEVYRRIYSTGIKVVLDGTGADELFFGYSKYQNANQKEFWRLNIDGTKNALALTPKYSFSSESLLQANLLDIRNLKLPRSLRFIDKASMANSVEARVPYLSKEIWRIARSVGIDWHIDSSHTKKSLRECLKRNSGINAYAPKWNTQIPLHDWMKTNWNDELVKLFRDPQKLSLLDVWQFDPSPLSVALAEFRSNRHSDLNLIWRMTVATFWINAQSHKALPY